MTAAHCVDGGTSGTAIFGAHFFRDTNEPNQRRIDFLAPHIFMHPSWNPLLIQNDVAVVQVPILVPIIPTAIRQAILPSAGDVNYDFANEDAGKNSIFLLVWLILIYFDMFGGQLHLVGEFSHKLIRSYQTFYDMFMTML